MANFYRISAVFIRDCCQTTGPDKFHFDTLISVPRRILIRCALMSPWNLFSNPNDTSPIKFDVPRQGEGRGGVSIFRRGFSHLLTLERRRFLLCEYVVDELKDANRFINLREPSGASILFVFRGWSIPVRAVTADTATPGSTPPRDDGKFAAEIKLAPRFRNWFPRRRIGGRPKFVSPRVEINFRIENTRSSNIREFHAVCSTPEDS